MMSLKKARESFNEIPHSSLNLAMRQKWVKKIEKNKNFYFGCSPNEINISIVRRGKSNAWGEERQARKFEEIHIKWTEIIVNCANFRLTLIMIFSNFNFFS